MSNSAADSSKGSLSWSKNRFWNIFLFHYAPLLGAYVLMNFLQTDIFIFESTFISLDGKIKIIYVICEYVNYVNLNLKSIDWEQTDQKRHSAIDIYYPNNERSNHTDNGKCMKPKSKERYF